LSVRRILWSSQEDTKPKLEMLTSAGWERTKNYEAARQYAEQHGYSGIRVRVIG